MTLISRCVRSCLVIIKMLKVLVQLHCSVTLTSHWQCLANLRLEQAVIIAQSINDPINVIYATLEFELSDWLKTVTRLKPPGKNA